MSLTSSQFDPGYSVSVAILGGSPQPRWAFSRVPLTSELPKLPVRAPGKDQCRVMDPPPAEDDFERWDGLS